MTYSLILAYLREGRAEARRHLREVAQEGHVRRRVWLRQDGVVEVRKGAEGSGDEV